MHFDRYDRIVDHYQAMWPLLVPGYLPILASMLDVCRARHTPPQRILDLGCGPASATVAIAPACAPSAQVTLVDGSSRMLAAGQTLLGAQVALSVNDDFTRDGLLSQVAPARSFDTVLCSFALHHLEDASKRQVLEHLANCLVPGGVMLLADEIATDRPAGWDLVERIRGRQIGEHLSAGRIPEAFWQLETTLPPELVLPFKPSRIDDLTSWLARSGLAVAAPVRIMGAALLVGVKS